jgi:hypothetical protein
MARTINTIAQTMFVAKAAEPELDKLNSTSKVSTWRLWIYIVAACINVFEQILDVFKTEMETIAANAIPGTEPWVQDRTFHFQYSPTVTQFVQIVNNKIVYPVEDDALKIIKRCSVTTLPTKVVQIKVAKATSATDPTPTQLNGIEKNALISFWNLIGFAGIEYSIVTLLPDRIGVIGDIYYSGQYSPTISATVIDGINSYLANIAFNGNVNIQLLEDAIRKVPGITDVKLSTVSGRAQATAFSSRNKFFDLPTSVNNRNYFTAAGYCIEEDTAGQTFADTLTFKAG